MCRERTFGSVAAGIVLAILLAFPVGKLVLAQGQGKGEKTYPFFPDRPVELNMLGMFVGDWDTQMEVKARGEVMASRTTRTCRWANDQWALLCEWQLEASAPKPGPRLLRGLEIMTWDAPTKVYVRWGCNSRGTIGTDTLTYDEKARTWHGSTQQKDYYGTAQTDRFTETFVDANTIDQKGSNWKATLRRRR